MSGGPSYKSSSRPPEGVLFGPTLLESKPDALDPSLTVFIVAVSYAGPFNPQKPLREALEGTANLLSLNDAIKRAEEEKEAYRTEAAKAIRNQETYSDAIRRCNERIERQVKEGKAKAWRSRNEAIRELEKLKSSLRRVGRAMGIKEE